MRNEQARPANSLSYQAGVGIDPLLTWVNSAALHIAGRKIGASIRLRLAARSSEIDLVLLRHKRLRLI